MFLLRLASRDVDVSGARIPSNLSTGTSVYTANHTPEGIIKPNNVYNANIPAFELYFLWYLRR